MQFIILILFIITLYYFFSNNKEHAKSKKIDIDEKISVEDYKKSKAILNSVELEKISTRYALNQIVDKLAEIDNSEFCEAVKKVDFNTLKASLIEMRDCINAMDLDSQTAISTRELYQGTLTDEQMKEAEDKINGIEPKQSFWEKFWGYYSAPENAFLYDMMEEKEEVIFNSYNKNQRIKKKHAQVEKLEQEHKFQRGYIPYWDTEEQLYDKYKNDEEKYLDAKFLELKEKNLSHDMYMTEDEKRIYGDDIDGGMW